jgi:diguanylate cyclase (GGDEF)-like protein/PAS domain S-box-containing protein
MADSKVNAQYKLVVVNTMTGFKPSKNPLLITELAATIRAFRQCAQLDEKAAAAKWGINTAILKQLESDDFTSALDMILKNIFTQQETFITIKEKPGLATSAEDFFYDVFAHSPLVAFQVSAAANWPINFISSNIVNLIGYTADELHQTSFARLIHPEDLPHVEAIVNNYFEEGILNGSIEYRLMHSNGSAVHVIEYSSSFPDENGHISFANGIIQDVTALKLAQETADALTFYDPLTGLENRDLFKKRLEHTIKLSSRKKTSCALLFLDIDRFKMINDSLGHDAGDTLLKIVAERLRKCLREEDTIARLGGDEFAVILPNIDAISGADIVAQNILNSLNAPVHLLNQDLNITASIGITMAPDDATDIIILLKNAELAMYQSKSQGRNTYRFYINNMNAAVEERLFIQNGLRHAIDYNELVVFFQPQVNLQTKKMMSMEALIRWRHPDRGMIPPLDFISIAEESGLIIDIGNWILREACKKAQEIIKAGLPPIKVCVNLSAVQFKDKNLVTSVKSALIDTGLHPDYLELEITESMLMDNFDDVLVQLHNLKKIGISLSIDDFGTGYSSLSYLKRLPIDIVKVDQSFVRDIPHDLNDMEITSAVISMAHNLQLKVVAEGVETEDQQDFLTISKCDYAQGYFFSKPVPGDMISSVIRAHNDQKNSSAA